MNSLLAASKKYSRMASVCYINQINHKRFFLKRSQIIKTALYHCEAPQPISQWFASHIVLRVFPSDPLQLLHYIQHLTQALS